MPKLHIPNNQNDFCGVANSVATSAELLFKALDDLAPQDDTDAARYAIGGSILGPFGLELLLKAAISLNSKDKSFPEGHNLEALYNYLPAELKKDFSQKYLSLKVGEKTIESYLKDHKNAFVEFRYLATGEKTKMSFDLEGTRILSSILSEYVCKKTNPNASPRKI